MKNRLKFLEKMGHKYPTHSLTCLGCYERDKDGNIIESDTYYTVGTEDYPIPKTVRLDKSLKIIKLASLHLIAFKREVERFKKEIEQNITTLNIKHNYKYFTYEVSSSTQSTFNKIARWYIYSNIALVAQLKVECKDIFKELIESLRWLEQELGVLDENIEITRIDKLLDTWVFKNAEKAVVNFYKKDMK